MSPRLRALLPQRARLLPALVAAMALLLGAKAVSLLREDAPSGAGDGAASATLPLIAQARAVGRAQAQGTGAPTGAPAAPAGAPASGTPRAAGGPAPPPPAAVAECEAPPGAARPQVAEAERSLLEGLRARRAELERREQAAAEREMLLAAAERRIGQRVEELTALQQRMESLDRTRTEREEQGWRQMVKLYEGMRPRDAAAIFDELEMPVLLQILDRMGERKAAPVLGAMRPERARSATAELARHRAAPRPPPSAGGD